MSATPFRPISWAPLELVTEDKLDQIANNAQWLFENDVRGTYSAQGVRRAEGIKIMGSIVTFPASADGVQTKSIYFNNFFSTGCKPVVTTGVVSFQLRTFIITSGLGVMFPDYRGFDITCLCLDSANKSRIERTFYVQWIAMGY